MGTALHGDSGDSPPKGTALHGDKGTALHRDIMGYNGDSPPKEKFPKSLSCELDESIIKWKNINFFRGK